MQQSRVVLACLLLSVPLCVASTYETSKATSSHSEAAPVSQASSEVVTQVENVAEQAKSAANVAEAKAAQQVHAADSEAAQAQSAMKAAEAKATQAEAAASQAQLAEKAEAAKAAQQVYAAQKDATNAQAAEKAEKSYAAARMIFMSQKAAKQVHSAQSEAASARSAQTKTQHESSVIGHLLVAFPMIVIAFFVFQKTPKGRAFKERMSERISGVVGRKDDKKKPLLSKSEKDKNAVAPIPERAIAA